MDLSPGRSSLARMGKAFIGFLCSAVAGYFAIKWQMHSDVEYAVDMATLGLSPYAVVQYDGVSSTMTGELTIDGIRARVKGFQDEIFIERLGIDTPSFWHLMKLGDVDTYMEDGTPSLPEYFGVIVEGIRVPTDADYLRRIYTETIEELGVSDDQEPAQLCTGKYGYSPRALQAMGYPDLNLSFTAGFRQLGSRFAMEAHSSAADMFEMDINFVFAGDMMTEFAKGTRYKPKMAEMQIEYTDRSLNGRMARYCASLGLTEEQVQTAMIESFRFFGTQQGIEFDEYVMEPYADFLDGKQTFIVTASPREPVTISQIGLYKPSDVPALLELSAETR